MSRKKLNGKIGYCRNDKLGISNPSNEGHYVYIRKDNGNTVDVNIITSLEDEHSEFKTRKIRKIKTGLLYPIPKKDSNLRLWSGVDLTQIKNVKKEDIQNVGIRSVKKRHKWFIGLFGNKIRGSRN